MREGRVQIESRGQLITNFSCGDGPPPGQRSDRRHAGAPFEPRLIFSARSTCRALTIDLRELSVMPSSSGARCHSGPLSLLNKTERVLVSIQLFQRRQHLADGPVKRLDGVAIHAIAEWPVPAIRDKPRAVASRCCQVKIERAVLVVGDNLIASAVKRSGHSASLTGCSTTSSPRISGIGGKGSVCPFDRLRSGPMSFGYACRSKDRTRAGSAGLLA